MQEPGIPSVGRVQEVFERILAQPEFRDRSASPLAELVDRVLRALERLIARWLPDVADSQVRFVSWVLLVATVCVAALVAWRWVSGRTPAAARRVSGADAREAPRDAAGWASWARGEAEAGRLRDAATGVYQAVVLHLEGRGALRYGEWKTPGDYAAEADASVRVPFRTFLGHFVTIAFGPAEPSPDALAALFTRAERLGCPT